MSAWLVLMYSLRARDMMVVRVLSSRFEIILKALAKEGFILSRMLLPVVLRSILPEILSCFLSAMTSSFTKKNMGNRNDSSLLQDNTNNPKKTQLKSFGFLFQSKSSFIFSGLSASETFFLPDF